MVLRKKAHELPEGGDHKRCSIDRRETATRPLIEVTVFLEVHPIRKWEHVFS